MEVRKPRGPGDIALGFFLLCHPVPVLLHVLVVTMFALLASWTNLIWETIILVVAAHTAMQLSIAVLNDYCDRHLDILSKRNKPLARGLVYPHEALIFGLLLIAVMLLLLWPLPRLALLLSLIYLVLGQGYNLGLKSTPLSGIAFALAIPLIPVYAFVGVGRSSPFLFWLIPVAALLGVALNLANSLPDIHEDAANGARTLAVVLGEKKTLLACPALLVSALLCIGALAWAHVVVVQVGLLLATVVLSILLLVGLLFILLTPHPALLYKRYFYLVVASCIVIACGWIGGILSV